MDAIVLTDDDLRILERRFGPNVRKMGPWNSDGTFGYSCVSMADVKKAAESMEDSDLMMALWRLIDAPGTEPFLELLETFGQPLIERTVSVYRQGCFEIRGGKPLTNNPKEEATRSKAAMAG